MFLRVPSQNQTTLSRGIRPIRIFDRVLRGRVIGWTVKLPIQMIGCGSPKLRSALRQAFNSKPDNEADTAMFKPKRRLSSAGNACAARCGKCKRSQAFPASPSAITGSLPSHATFRGRGPDVSPGTKAHIAAEYAEASGKANGAGCSVAAKRGIQTGQYGSHAWRRHCGHP